MAKDIVKGQFEDLKLDEDFDLEGMEINLLKKSSSVRYDQDFFKKIMGSLMNDDAINEDFIDPIFLTIIQNPVVLSSGVVLDRSTAMKDGTI